MHLKLSCISPNLHGPIPRGIPQGHLKSAPLRTLVLLLCSAALCLAGCREEPDAAQVRLHFVPEPGAEYAVASGRLITVRAVREGGGEEFFKTQSDLNVGAIHFDTTLAFSGAVTTLTTFAGPQVIDSLDLNFITMTLRDLNGSGEIEIPAITPALPLNRQLRVTEGGSHDITIRFPVEVTYNGLHMADLSRATVTEGIP